MKILKREIKLCLICMEEHEVQTVRILETEEFKNEIVSFYSTYEYCDRADEYLEDEDLIKSNSLAMKDAYRKVKGLLTSKEIVGIRKQYSISQKDFAEILGWGQATITRYENHQVQDTVHDDVLRKIKSDPKWFLQMLARANGNISAKAFEKYSNQANLILGKMQNNYLIDSIHALYTRFKNAKFTGGTALNLEKVVDIINYYALKVNSLHKVKLLKMLWYADALSYKRSGHSITGLVYGIQKMGAVPVGSELIMDLDNVEFETIFYEPDMFGYKFKVVNNFKISELAKGEIDILDDVIKEVGHLNSREIIAKMHSEDAYRHTEKGTLISFDLTKTLSID